MREPRSNASAQRDEVLVTAATSFLCAFERAGYAIAFPGERRVDADWLALLFLLVDELRDAEPRSKAARDVVAHVDKARRT